MQLINPRITRIHIAPEIAYTPDNATSDMSTFKEITTSQLRITALIDCDNYDDIRGYVYALRRKSFVTKQIEYLTLDIDKYSFKLTLNQSGLLMGIQII